MVLVGRDYLNQLRLTQGQRATLCRDLGWTTLWAEAVVSALVLYAKMRSESLEFLHARWANSKDLPKGSWVVGVRTLQRRFGVLDVVLPPEFATMRPLQRRHVLVVHEDPGGS